MLIESEVSDFRFGSKDQSLLARARKILQESEGGETPVDPTKGPRIKVTWNSEMYFNGKRVTKEEFVENLRQPEWAGTELHLYQEIDPPVGKKREGEFKELGTFARGFLHPLIKYEVTESGEVKRHIRGVNGYSTEKDFLSAGECDDDITDDQALEELILGKITRRQNGPTYGYALENLCHALGTFLDAVGTDELRSLNLKTPLSKKRSPVKLPKIEDFPYISYLDAEELRAEVGRLQAMDIAYPQDAEVDQERRRFLQLLETAAEKNLGVVGFYH